MLVGSGSRHDALRSLAAQRGVTDHVIFAGFVPDDELPAAYAACDVFANAGIAELQSLVTMEAMASGKPIVAADAMAFPHLVRHGHNGYRFAPGDVQAAASHLVRLLQDRRLRHRMGQASLQLIGPHDLVGSLEQYEALYERAAALASHVVSRARPLAQPYPQPTSTSP